MESKKSEDLPLVREINDVIHAFISDDSNQVRSTLNASLVLALLDKATICSNNSRETLGWTEHGSPPCECGFPVSFPDCAEQHALSWLYGSEDWSGC